ncbi:hypothetical protein [Paraburkholderia bengalensis]|uniref:hypothetical protein n=1 Tax=Paraburkholderia bengalensis TaxID=2747562 RepID=UPI0030144E68
MAGDPVLVRASLFNLLREGRVSAPELHTQFLSLRTKFVVVEAISCVAAMRGYSQSM